MGSITTWARLEPHSRAADMEAGLEMRQVGGNQTDAVAVVAGQIGADEMAGDLLGLAGGTAGRGEDR